MSFNHGGLAIPIGLAEITGYNNAILFGTLHGTIPKCETNLGALSRPQIRVDKHQPWRTSPIFGILEPVGGLGESFFQRALLAP